MPIKRYFQGHGNEVMASMRKAHPGYSEKRVKAEFYATANTQGGMKPRNAMSKSKRAMRDRSTKGSPPMSMKEMMCGYRKMK